MIYPNANSGPEIPRALFQLSFLGNGRKGYLFSETSKLLSENRQTGQKNSCSGCLRESLRFAFLVETFERVAGKDEAKIVQHIVDRRVKRKNISQNQ